MKDKTENVVEFIPKGATPTTTTKPRASNTPKVPPKKPGTVGKRCYHSHPPLPIMDGIVIYGGNGSVPIVKDADIYVGLDWGMGEFKQMFPWNEGVAFLFKIPDMNVPTSVLEFKKLIEWMSVQLIAGKKVHVGCIGGHGRTGMVFSALVNHMTGNVDSTAYVREHYCKKAVESQKQIDWLNKHFGITPVEPVKMFGSAYGTNMGQGSMFPQDDEFGNWYGKGSSSKSTMSKNKEVRCVPVEGHVWGKNKPKK